MKKPNPLRPPQRAKSLRHQAAGIERTLRAIKRWPSHPDVEIGPIRELISKAWEALHSAADELDKLPETFPPKTLPTSALIRAGAIVRIRAMYRPHYENLIPGAELDHLTVVEVNAHSFLFLTNSGVKSMAPKKHAQVIQG